MSAGTADWQLLGIAPTEENRAIRAAYAARLKAIDPESDPQAFIRLRNAYERALAAAAVTCHATSPGAVLPLEDAQDTAETPENDAAEGHAHAIAKLLLGQDNDCPWLLPDEQERLIEHWRALIADPRMEALGHADRVERWASVLIAETSPLSAPILMLAAEHFGWVDADQNIHSSSHVAELARRYRLLQLLHAASRPGSRHHQAWVELHKPSQDFSTTRRLNPRHVFEVIAAMRYALPQLGRDFDPIRLEIWELRATTGDYSQPGQPLGGFRWLTILFFAVSALAMAVRAMGT